MATLLLAIAAAGALVLTSTPAAAHDRLTSATPEEDGTIRAAPQELVLRFSADPRAVSLSAVDAEGQPVPLGQVARDGDVARAAWPGTAAAGRFIVSWRIISSDGHQVGGSYTITIDPDAADVGPGAEPGAGPGGRGLLVSGCAGLGVLAVGAAIVLRRRRPGDEGP